ncbi:helix-turn-helix domain-containing protein [Bacterioplanoides sp.]|uniref:helix-turn-helix domain-containing protein n=1 Tax=Bacterioplanoides sp. TaxID=2066072 RepID=UPI003B5A9A06
MKTDNQFRYQRSKHLNDVTMLRAEINDFSYDKHAHEELSIGLTRQGLQHFNSSGSFHRSEPGNIVLFNPEQVHDGHGEAGNTLLYDMLYIHPQQLRPMLEAAGVKQVDNFRVSNSVIGDALLGDSVLMLSELISQQSNDALILDYWLYQLCARMAAYQQEFVPNQVVRKADQLLVKSKEFIQDHVRADITLDDVGNAIGMSKYHFLRLFRSQFGITPHQYIVSCKINAARSELEKGTGIDDVVFDFGFSDLSHFNRRFKPIYGMTPKQYQKSVLG